MSTATATETTASVLVVKTAGAFKCTVGAHTCYGASATLAAREAGAQHFACAERDIEVELLGATLSVRVKGAS